MPVRRRDRLQGALDHSSDVTSVANAYSGRHRKQIHEEDFDLLRSLIDDHRAAARSIADRHRFPANRTDRHERPQSPGDKMPTPRPMNRLRLVGRC